MFGKFRVNEFGLKNSKLDYFVLVNILLVVYAYNIINTGSDSAGIASLKSFLQTKFHSKLGAVEILLGIRSL